MKSSEINLPISDLIRITQNELIISEKKRNEEGISPLFKTERCEMDFSFVIKRIKNKVGKIDFKLVALTADDKIAEELTQRIKLSFSTIEDNEFSSGFTGRRPRYGD